MNDSVGVVHPCRGRTSISPAERWDLPAGRPMAARWKVMDMLLALAPPTVCLAYFSVIMWSDRWRGEQ